MIPSHPMQLFRPVDVYKRQVHRNLAEQLKEHSIKRRYRAIVQGNIKEDEGTVDAPIGRHPIDRKKMAINHKNGKEAVTHYKVLERFGQTTYICLLYTSDFRPA